ncbi:MAG: carbohydrate ABC transporter permease [Marvinbryantia sp.]|jgi:multiple sugar transport system permease protein
MRMHIRHRLGNTLSNIVLIMIGIAFAIPAIWLFLAAFDPEASLAIRLPETWTLENFKFILQKEGMLKGFLNSVIIASCTTLIIDVVSIMAAYPLSRYKTKTATNVSLGLLFLTSLPASAMMLSTYKLLVNFRQIDSMFGLIMVMAAGSTPYAIWMMKNFMDTVSVELEEAAWVDGATKLQALRKVLLPLILPGFITVTTYNFIGAWGNFYLPFLTLMSADKFPASVNIYRLYDVHGEVIYGQVAAYALLYIIPIFILYHFSQDNMSQGFSMGGATKG